MSTEMRRWNEPVDTDWHTAAVCRTREVSPQVWQLFDPVGLDESKQAAWDRARLARDAFCSVCPVRAACRAEGAEHEYEGLWGGEFRERRGVVDLDTGLVVRGDLVEVDPDDLDLDDLDFDDEDEGAEPVEVPDPVDTEPEPEPEPEVGEGELIELVIPVELPAPVVPRRRRRFELRAPRRLREPSVGVQLALDDLGAPRRTAVPRRAVHEPSAEVCVAV